MRNIIISLIFIFFIGCSQNTTSGINLKGKKLPNIDVVISDNQKHFNTQNISEGHWTILFYFNPKCPHCRIQMREMTEKINELKDFKILAFSFAETSKLNSFTTEFKLSNYNNIIVGSDYSDSVIRYYKIRVIPFTAIYDPRKIFRQSFSGKVSVQTIKDVTENKY